ncbi:MAG: sugar phosphate isomerase/epimerase [Clostridiales bacterium]|nr:sugar phosphate isomerase/epimerase [Clostridiales bacterium]
MGIKRGVDFYSYQQAQFFKELDLEGMMQEAASIEGVTGVEVLDEQSFPYPDPSDAFVEKWHGMCEKYHLEPVTMDVFCDVLQFRDHVMSFEECAERLKHDIRLAKKLGFKNVRTLATTNIEILELALPTAEECDIRIAKEIHAPIPLNGQYVKEIQEVVHRTGTKRLGIVPDWGIFAYRPSEVTLDWYVRQGAKRKTCDLVDQFCMDNYTGKSDALSKIDLSLYSGGNVESFFHAYLKTGRAPEDLKPAFEMMERMVKDNVPDYTDIDFEVMGQALLLSRAKPEDLIPLLPIIVNFHGKFYNMSEVEGQPGVYEDKAVDYEGPIKVLKEYGYDGFINTEYECQRRFQDRTEKELISEVDQVRKHQGMMQRLIEG